MTASWTIALSLAVLAAGPSGRWLGQDGHDLTSTSSTLEPNGFQDIRIAITGLPTARTITKVEVRPYGGGLWEYNSNSGSWKAALERAPGSPTANLYMESDQVEKGREYHLRIFYDDASIADVYVKGGKSDPNRRMPGAMPVAKWVGQDRQDMTGAGPGVGPDGLQDARIALSNLPTKVEVKSVVIESGTRWHAGLNPKGDSNAELVRDAKDPAKAALFFQPDRDLAGRTLIIRIAYKNDKTDTLRVSGERTDPKLAMPPQPLPNLGQSPLKARWAGQDGGNPASPGDVHIALTGLSTKKTLEALVLSDSIQGTWVFRSSDRVKLEPVPGEQPLVFRVGSDPSKADLFLTPYRNERGATMTLRLVYKGGEMSVARFPGGECDPLKSAVAPESSTVLAKPGDDLQDLVNRYGTVTLASGTHRLSRPLVLEKPITLAGERGAILEFSQKPGDAPWTAAIKIHSGATTLRDFAVRFVGRWWWDYEVSYSPAVIGTTDNKDAPHPDPKRNLTFSRLDLVAPAATGKDAWQEAPRLLRLVTASSGRVDHCVLTGGQIEFFGGPWQFLENESLGTPAGTYNHAVIVGHNVHDVVIQGNRVKSSPGLGKVWRFVVLTGRGHSVRIEGNTVVGIGPRDDDTIPSMNAPEVILTESYRLGFEGKIVGVSPDGRVLRTGAPQGAPPVVGDVVSVLAGPGAGQWRTIAQAISTTTFLLDSPLPKGTTLVSLGSGFLDTRIEGNTIDCRGSKTSSSLVLAGNHFGTTIRKNRFEGGGEALRIVAAPTEAPMIWGWSHCPYLGGIVEENVIEDAFLGSVLGVEHSDYVKSNVGRTYMTLALRNNTIRWSEGFLREHQKAGGKTPLRGITLGYAPSLDPGELVVTEEGDRLEAPAGVRGRDAVHVHGARVNGKTLQNKGFVLPAGGADPKVSRANPR